MPNYQQTLLSGEAYTRASQVIVANPLSGTKAISFMEEQVVNLGSEQLIRPQGGIQEPLTAENILSEFPLLNPEDSSELGLSMTYRDVYIALHSLYFHVARKRDEAKLKAEQELQSNSTVTSANSVI